MLSGRKLLLSDDSITIQKLVELTFSDEGVKVICVSNGREALERLEEFVPDIVLADVFMPHVSGYEVCEYIKQSENLKHIPVMLLVGSFEPFDEAEARRVGANDTLTKPFQSIRRLLEKVGVLVAERPPQEQIPTAELPQHHQEPEPERLTEAELEVTTADTKPLRPGTLGIPQMAQAAATVDRSKFDIKPRQTNMSTTQNDSDVLLDLGDFAPSTASAENDFELDLDFDDVSDARPIERSVTEPPAEATPSWSASAQGIATEESELAWPSTEIESPSATTDQLAETQEFPRHILETPSEPETPLAQAMAEQESHRVESSPSSSTGGQITLEQLSPEVIDAIARRAVEQLSERAVQEIAWEVVPQLAELMIKRQLEEKSS